MQLLRRLAWRRMAYVSLAQVCLLGATSTFAATWTNTAGGLYDSAGNWSGGVPNAAGAIADFSTLNTSGDLEVLMDSSVTVGQLLFGDTDNPGSPTSWFLGPNGAATPTLTLDNGASSPIISVTPLGVTGGGFDDAFISTPIAGTNGFTKNGDGILTIGAAATDLTGTINLNAGTLRYDVAGTHTAATTMPINMANGTVLQSAVPSDVFHSVNIASGADVTIRQLGGGSNFLNTVRGQGTGETLNLEFGVSGATYSTEGDWGDGLLANVNATGLDAGGQSNFRLRINRPAPNNFNANAFSAAHLNLDNVRLFAVTNSFGNNVPIAELSGTATATIAGGGSGSAVRYIVGSANTNSEFAGMFDGAGGYSLNKVGTGTLTLSGGVNGVSPVLNNPGDPGRQGGVVRVTEGTLATAGTFDHFESGIAAINATVDIKAGATLDVSGSTGFHSVPFQQYIGAGTVKGNFDHQAGNINPGDVGVVDNDTDLTNVLVPTAGTMTFDGNLSFNGGTIVFDMNATPGGDDLISVTGTTNLGTGGMVQPSFLGADPAPGLTYTFLNSAGGFTGSTSGWNVVWPGRGAKPTVVQNGNSLQFTTTTVGAVGDVVWSGAVNGDWNIETTQNWTLGGSPDVYFDADNVTFNDSGTTTAVNVAASVSPSSFVVDSSTKNYTFSTSSGGSIGGSTSLIKRGSSTLTMSLGNSFTGGAIIEGGTIDVGATPGALGSGTLELKGGTTLTRTGGLNSSSIVISGAGVTINNNSTGDPGTPTITGSGSFTFTTDDTAKTVSINATETFAGTVNFVPAAGGTLALRLGGPTSDFPDAVVNLTATSLANRNGSSAPTATFSYGEIHADAASSFNAFGGGSTTIPDVILEIGGLNTDSNFDGTINDGTGGGGATATTSLVKIGTGELALNGVNTYTGNTTVDGGTLVLNNGFLSDMADVLISNGAFLELNFGGQDIIDSLYLDGAPQAIGTYGAIGNASANFQTPFILGTGMLSVTTVGDPLTMPGDFDDDGDVDGIDFLIWQRGGSPNGATPADLAEWQGAYGSAPPVVANGSGNLAAVPEPGTVVLLAACGFGLLASRKRS